MNIDRLHQTALAIYLQRRDEKHPTDSCDAAIIRAQTRSLMEESIDEAAEFERHFDKCDAVVKENKRRAELFDAVGGPF